MTVLISYPTSEQGPFGLGLLGRPDLKDSVDQREQLEACVEGEGVEGEGVEGKGVEGEGVEGEGVWKGRVHTHLCMSHVCRYVCLVKSAISIYVWLCLEFLHHSSFHVIIAHTYIE